MEPLPLECKVDAEWQGYIRDLFIYLSANPATVMASVMASVWLKV